MSSATGIITTYLVLRLLVRSGFPDTCPFFVRKSTEDNFRLADHPGVIRRYPEIAVPRQGTSVARLHNIGAPFRRCHPLIGRGLAACV